MTQMNGTAYDSLDFMPFGEQILGGSGTNRKFTGKERDSESNLDNFGARYDSSQTGRFLSVDPSGKGANPANPQTWSGYAYALNNPLAYVDRNGLWPTYIHNEIYNAVFGGFLPTEQLKLIERVSAAQDSVIPGQFSKNASWHAQCSSGQSMSVCKDAIANHIQTNLAAARNLGDVQGLSDAALTYFAIAAHTLTDKGSPSHTAPNGDPTTWGGIFGPGAWSADIAHIRGEENEAQSWSGIGRSVRNLVDNFFDTFPEEAGRTFHGASASAVSQRAIEQIVSAYYENPSAVPHLNEEDAARQCALGNPAACD